MMTGFIELGKVNAGALAFNLGPSIAPLSSFLGSNLAPSIAPMSSSLARSGEQKPSVERSLSFA